MMYAAGDAKNPNRDSVLHIHNHLDTLINIIFSPEILQNVVKYQNPVLKKNLKFQKMLKYLDRVFRVETCTYFSSIELKVSSFTNKLSLILTRNICRVQAPRRTGRKDLLSEEVSLTQFRIWRRILDSRNMTNIDRSMQIE